MFLYTTPRTLLANIPEPESAVAILGRADAGDGLPFILDADGRYDVQLNRFIRELPSSGIRPNVVLLWGLEGRGL
ncbi:hypothetical protein P3T36_007729 [Kitasatospora sp. MAP12-15]|uniref:hypothetical protein n=1 Tax=unclassified Kitasatospora TaxID=2633591 RepID=UPI0024754349|nr:hypothetical protein [Kitasatospora sp. MAP12-44]MDH6115607.1 hypothetical protein [Kitasatospora sp. MAP12-44]